MRIQHNIMAMNAYRNYTTNTSALSKNLEKLSSGYKINRAGDDAAGLAISEKMRAQISGLAQAQNNAKSGINLVQTAEGALQEVHDMLNRMVTLADQSANGTYQDGDTKDRGQLQKEVDQLRTEIDRIADSANFNGINLLDGSLSGTGSTSAVSNIKLDGGLTVTDVDATKYKSGALAGTSVLAKSASVGDKISYSITYEQGGKQSTVSVDFTLGTNKDGDKVLVGSSGKEYAIADFDNAGVAATDVDKAILNELKETSLGKNFTITGNYSTGIVLEAKQAGAGVSVISAASSATVSGVTTTAGITVGAAATAGANAYQTGEAVLYDGTNADASVFTVNGKQYAMAANGTDVSGLDKNVTVIFGADLATAGTDAASIISKETGLSVTFDGADTFSFKSGTATNGGGGLTLQIGDTSDDFNQLNVSISDCHSAAMGISGIDISTQTGAQAAVDVIKAAIDYVSDVRGTLGATQNRLDHTINNLSVMEENIQDAESTIRDTDVADEMMAYTKNNILIQSAQAMLAQANQVPQGVLQLLQ